MHMFAKTCDTDANHNVRGAMNPAGRVRCNMENQIRLANHNCNFYRLKARVLLTLKSPGFGTGTPQEIR